MARVTGTADACVVAFRGSSTITNWIKDFEVMHSRVPSAIGLLCCVGGTGIETTCELFAKCEASCSYASAAQSPPRPLAWARACGEYSVARILRRGVQGLRFRVRGLGFAGLTFGVRCVHVERTRMTCTQKITVFFHKHIRKNMSPGNKFP